MRKGPNVKYCLNENELVEAVNNISVLSHYTDEMIDDQKHTGSREVYVRDIGVSRFIPFYSINDFISNAYYFEDGVKCLCCDVLHKKDYDFDIDRMFTRSGHPNRIRRLPLMFPEVRRVMNDELDEYVTRTEPPCCEVLCNNCLLEYALFRQRKKFQGKNYTEYSINEWEPFLVLFLRKKINLLATDINTGQYPNFASIRKKG